MILQFKEFLLQHRKTIIIVVISAGVGVGVGYKLGHKPQPDLKLQESAQTTVNTNTQINANSIKNQEVSKKNDTVKNIHVHKKVVTTKPDGTVVQEESETEADTTDKNQVDSHSQGQSGVQVTQQQQVKTVEKLVLVQKNTLPNWSVGVSAHWDRWHLAAPDRYEFELDKKILQLGDMGVMVGGSVDTKFNPAVNVKVQFP